MPTLPEVLARLDRLVDWERRDRAGMRVDVEPARDLLARLGRPELRFHAVHVAGTKGKGSVCALIDAGLRAAGRRTGRYASPHVERVHERILLDGHEIDDARLTQVLDRALNAQAQARMEGTAGRGASWFDVWTAAAFVAFADYGCDWAVVECGIGGRLDSTNAMDGEIAVLTNVDLEHTALLGNTHAAIARDKLGIVKPGRPLVTGVPPGSEAGAVVEEVAAERGSAVTFALGGPDASLRQSNLAIANAVLALAKVAPLDEAAARAVQLPGRMEIFEPSAATQGVTVVLDGAHVPSNLRAVLQDLRREARFRAPCVVVIGLGRDKDAAALMRELTALGPLRIVATAYRHGLPPHEPESLASVASDQGALSAHAIDRPLDALRQALAEAATLGDGAWVLVTGSLHVVGEVRGPLRATLSPA